MNRRNLGQGGYKVFVTFKSCPFMFSRRDLLFYSILNTYSTQKHSPTISEMIYFLRFLLVSPLLVLASCRIFYYFLLLESIWGEIIVPVLVLDSAWTWKDLWTLIHQEQRGNPSRIWLCNDQLHAKISSTVMQDLSMPLLTSYVPVESHSSMREPLCMWHASSVKWHGTFSQ